MSSTHEPPTSPTVATGLSVEKEHEGSIWMHPYMLYILLTTVLFVGLVLAGYLAWVNHWIPNRGTV